MKNLPNLTIGPININKFKRHIEQYLSPTVFKLIQVITKEKFLIFKDEYIRIHEFFALEFYAIFLYLSIFESKYKKYAILLENESWVKRIIHPVTKSLSLNFSIIDKHNITLYPHQKTFIEKYAYFVPTYDLKGRILAFEQGLGKTITSISLMLAREKERVLIVCPKNLINNWLNECKKCNILNVYSIDNLPKGSKKVDWLIINYDKLKYPIVTNFVSSSNNVGLLIDESHFIKDIRSQRTQKIISLVKEYDKYINDIVLISGTPIKGNINEWLPYFAIIDPHIDMPLAQLFVNIFLLDPILLKHIANVRMKIYITRELKKNVLKELPKKEVIDLNVKVTDPKKYSWDLIKSEILKTFTAEKIKEIKNKYLSNWYVLKEKLLAKGVKEKDLDEFLNICIRQVRTDIELKRVEDYLNQWLMLLDNAQDRKNLKLIKKLAYNFSLHVYGTIMGTIIQKYKVECIKDIIKNNISIFCELIHKSTKKTIVAGSVIEGLTDVKEKIETICNKKCIFVTGEVKDIERKQSIKDFVEKDDIYVLIGSIGVIGVGLTLTVASTMIILNMPWRYTDIEQVSDRIHRIGQNVSVKIYICKLNTPFLNIHSHMDKIANEAKNLVETVLSIL